MQIITMGVITHTHLEPDILECDFWFIDYTKAFVWITRNCGKCWKKWEYQTTWPVSWETCMQVRKQQLELDIEQQTGSK